MKFSTYGPNTSDRLALVSLNDRHRFSAYWPMRLTQIIGGKTWSISFTRFTTPEPIPTAPAHRHDRETAAEEADRA